jgi:hypothetical protein
MLNDGVDQNECRTAPFFRAYSANRHFESHTQGSQARHGLQIFRRYAAVESQLRCQSHRPIAWGRMLKKTQVI